jgi:hypothetical protein
VSYAEAFKEELLHFHECVHNDREPLTDGRDGREDIAFLQKLWPLPVRRPGRGGRAMKIGLFTDGLAHLRLLKR